MGKFFTFADRIVRIQFFEEEPVNLMLVISDETDKKIVSSGKMFNEADKSGEIDDRREKYRAALEHLIGEEKTAAILDRADELDSFAIFSVYRYILAEYSAQKVKNLSASGR